MPNGQSSLDRAIARNQTLTDSGQKVYSAEAPPAEAQLPPPLPTISGLPVRGVYPSNQTLATDFATTTKSSGTPMRSAIFPPPSPISVTKSKTTVIESTSSGSSSSALALSTNNTPNPVQSKLNFIGQNGISIASDANGNEIFSGSESAEIVGPGYVNTPGGDEAGILVQDWYGSSANGVGGFYFFLPETITTSDVTFNVQAVDSTYFYDMGIYGPFTGVEASLPLICRTGPFQYTTTPANGFTQGWLPGAVTMTPGTYFFAFTSDGGNLSTLQLNSARVSAYLYPSAVATVSTGTGSGLALPSAVTPQAKAPVARTSGANIDVPAQLYFVLS